MESIKNALFVMPRVGSGVFRVWMRSYLLFRSHIVISFGQVVIEPILYFVVFGFLLGSFVGKIDGVPYSIYFFPSLLGLIGTIIPFVETAFGGFNKLMQQKVYNSMLLTPLVTEEIVVGEILWAMTKTAFSALALLVFGLLYDLIPIWTVVPMLFVTILLSWVSASFGLCCVTWINSYSSLLGLQGFLLAPMCLFCHTFFPISEFSNAAHILSFLAPITHAVLPLRALALEQVNYTLFIHLGVLIVFAFVLMNLANAQMKRRLIK